MKLLQSYLRTLPIFFLLLLPAGSIAQQKRQQTKPVRKVAVANAPTFDSLLSTERYKVYVEVRGVGQVIGSNAIDELLGPVMKLAGPSKEFNALVKWLKTHADDVMTSRMLIATWPTARNIPEAVVAIEFDSADAAAKFEPKVNSFLPTVFPAPASEAPSSTTEAKRTEEKSPKQSSYYVRQIGSLILITPTPLTLQNLRPAGTKLLADDASFRVARNRFGSEQVFLYVDVRGIEKEEDDRRKEYEADDKKRRAAQVRQEIIEDQTPPQLDSELERIDPIGEASGEVVVAPPSSPDQPTQPPEPEDPLMSAMGLLTNAFFAGQTKWPDAIGIAISLESDSFDVRALMIAAPGERCDAVPFFPHLIPGPSVAPESASVLPADTELFAMLSLDLPEIYDAMSHAQQPGANQTEMPPVKETALVGPFAEIEKRLKLNLKEELLPLLGSEVVVSLPMKLLGGSFLSGTTTQVATIETSETRSEQKQTTDPGLLVAFSLRDKEGTRALLPKIVDSLGFKGASALAQTERREDTELVSYGNMLSYAFIENFLVVSSDAATIRHVVDSYLTHQTLSADPQFKNYTRWQPRQLQAQIYVSPALMESYKSWADQPSTLFNDQTREILARLTLTAQPVTYSLSNDGLGVLHELHIPKNLLLIAATGVAAEANPSPLIVNERNATGTMYSIAYAEHQYRSGKGSGSFGTIDQLSAEGLLSSEGLENHGYKFELAVLGSKFEVTATPIEYEKTGRLSYYIDDTNVLRGVDRAGGTATVADKPIY